MSKTVTIPDELADLLEQRRRAQDLPSLDAAAVSVLRTGLREDAEPYSVEELRTLIDEADASGPAEPWDAKKVRAEVLRRYAERKAG